MIATLALLTCRYRLSKRLTQELLSQLFRAPIAVGSISDCEQQVSAAVAAPVEAAREYAKQQTVKYADETGWKQGIKRLKVWLWVLRTSLVTVFLIRPSRATEVVQELLGKALGVLVTDRLGSYNWWPLPSRQLCWAHIKRHFKKFIDVGGESRVVGDALDRERRKLFKWWRRVRDGSLPRERFRRYVAPLRLRVRKLLEQGAACSHAKTAGTCTELLKLEPALWTFVRIVDVEPTNNFSEQSVRPAVIQRKLSFGTHSEAGSRYVERMLSITISLRQQGRNAIDYLADALQAALEGR